MASSSSSSSLFSIFEDDPIDAKQDIDDRGFKPIGKQSEYISKLMDIYHGKIGHSKSGGILSTRYGSGKTPMSLVVANRIKALSGGANIDGGGTLVIGPLSPLADWMKACNNIFQPPLSVFRIKGKSANRENAKIRTWYDIHKHDVFIISYDTLTAIYDLLVNEKREKLERKLQKEGSDVEKIRDKLENLSINGRLSPAIDGMQAIFNNVWSTIIFDEAHEMRNQSTTIHKAVMCLQAKFKIAATATIYNNNIDDVVSIFNATNISPPLGSWTELKSSEVLFKRAIEQCIDFYFIKEVTEEIATVASGRAHYKPTDILVHCEFASTAEKECYAAISAPNQLLTNTRREMACLGILDDSFENSKLTSVVPTKVQVVLKYLEVPIQRKEKAFIICEHLQSVEMLKHYIGKTIPSSLIFTATYRDNAKQRSWARIGFDRVDGFAVMISTNVFTQGVDLSQANHTVLFSPWWNGVVADQGLSRCERPSQTRSTFTVQIIIKNTIEEDMWNVAHQKRKARTSLMSLDYSEDNYVNNINIAYARELLGGHCVSVSMKESVDIYLDKIENFVELTPQTLTLEPYIKYTPLVDAAERDKIYKKHRRERDAFLKKIKPSKHNGTKQKFIIGKHSKLLHNQKTFKRQRI